MSNIIETTSPGVPEVSPTAEILAENSQVGAGSGEQNMSGTQDVTIANGAAEVPPAAKSGGWPVWPVILLVVLVVAAGVAVFLKSRKAAKRRPRRGGSAAAPIGSTMPVGPQSAAANRRAGANAGAHVRNFAVNQPRTAAGGRPPVRPAASPSAQERGTVHTEVVEDDELNVSRYRVGYAQTVGKRGNQEDSYCISSQEPQEVARRGLLAAVADGIGGLNDGEVASDAAMRSMCNLFPQQDPDREPADRLLELAGRAQEDVLKINEQGNRCGCTLVCVLIHDSGMVMLSVGDSRIALYRSGMLLQLNREHVLGKESDEEQMLNGAGPAVEGSRRKAITAYLGKENLRLIDRTLTPMRLVSGDRVLLMSDGVFGTLNDDEIIARMAMPPAQAAKEIIRAVDEKNLPHQDNATIVIVGVN